jgi:hypothetical protein
MPVNFSFLLINTSYFRRFGLKLLIGLASVNVFRGNWAGTEIPRDDVMFYISFPHIYSFVSKELLL